MVRVMALAWTKLLAAKLGDVLRSRSGSITPLFAVLAVPLVIAVGVAVDVGRASSSRANLQDALDAAGLAISHLPSSTPSATVQADAQNWLKANMHDNSIGTPTVSVTVSATSVVLSANASVPTTVGGIAGISQVPISAHTTVQWGLSHIELALVLDNTGSMADDNKLTSLVTAAGTLVDTLSASVSTNDPTALKIGVVPFSMTVNIGSQYQGQTWLAGAMPNNYGSNGSAGTDIFTTSTNRFTLLSKMGVGWRGCVEDRPMPYDIQDTAPTPTVPGTMFVPFFAPDEPDNSSAIKSTSTNTRTGKVTNTYWANFTNNYLNDSTTATDWQTRQGNPSKYTTAPARGTNNYWGDAIGPNSGCQTAPLQRLTTNMTLVKNELSNMIAAGDTEIPVGLVWGWHLLSPNAPFADGSPYGTANTTKIAVLVTDGQNTYGTGSNSADNSYYTALGYIWQNRISTNGGDFSNPASALNDRLAQLCTNMKAQNIVIYTVPVEVTDPTIQSLLQNCASSPSNYINVTSSSQLQAAFANIAGSIGHLRLSQ
jgi:Flp pilus assembly protein TadG